MLVMLQLVHSLVSPHNSKVTMRRLSRRLREARRRVVIVTRATVPPFFRSSVVVVCGVQRLILVYGADSSETVDPYVVVMLEGVVFLWR